MKAWPQGWRIDGFWEHLLCGGFSSHSLRHRVHVAQRISILEEEAGFKIMRFLTQRRPLNAAISFLTLALLSLVMPNPAQAQVIPFEETDTYDIAKVASRGFCFAATQLKSQNSHAVVYTYYQTVAGQRWHVVSYADASILGDGAQSLRVSIDGDLTLERATEARDGDFMLPFETLDEITAHEKRSAMGASKVIALTDVADTITLDLEAFRAIIPIMRECLVAFEKEE